MSPEHRSTHPKTSTVVEESAPAKGNPILEWICGSWINSLLTVVVAVVVGCLPGVAFLPNLVSVALLVWGMFAIPVKMLSLGAGFGSLLNEGRATEFVVRHWSDFRIQIIITTLAFVTLVLLILARIALAKISSVL